jgi:hypothetical protein
MSSKTDWSYINIWCKKIKAIELLGGKCLKCGNSNPLVLEFHHLKNKNYNVSDIKEHRWSKIEKEIKNCMLLCSTCHRIHEHEIGNKKNIENKKYCLSYLNADKCEKCGFTSENYRGLDFHHIDKNTKLFGIQRKISSAGCISVSSVHDELKKCKVLCRNCHRLEHTNVERFLENKDKIYRSAEKIKEISPKIDVQLVRKLYNGGMQQVKIAKKLGCAKSTICGIIKNINIKVIL